MVPNINLLVDSRCHPFSALVRAFIFYGSATRAVRGASPFARPSVSSRRDTSRSPRWNFAEINKRTTRTFPVEIVAGELSAPLKNDRGLR